MKAKMLVSTVLVSALLLVASGCSQSNMARTNYDNRLNSAYSQIQHQRYDAAIKHLEEAEKIGKENNYDKTQPGRLMAEAYLGTGNTIEAYNQAKTLLDADAEDPVAMELMGKVCLKETRYADAEKYFVDAQSRYEQQKDSLRITDLISLTRGLTEYHNGNPRVASKYFKEIQNVELQYAVNKMEKDVSVGK